MNAASSSAAPAASSAPVEASAPDSAAIEPASAIESNPVVSGFGEFAQRITAGDFGPETWVLLWTSVGWPLTKAVILIVVVLLLAGWARRATRKIGARIELDKTLTRFVSNVARWAVLLAGGVAVLGTLGIETTSLAAALAAVGFAIGMALSGTLGAAAAGVLLLVFRPFKSGDFVKIGGVSGTVDEIGLFTTNIDTLDRVRVCVPNNKIFGDTIENASHHIIRRVEVPLGTDYGADVDQTRAVLEGVITNVEGGLKDPAPQVYLDGLGADSVEWKLRLFARREDMWTVRQRLVRDTKAALDAAGIGIPFPQRQLQMPPELRVRVGRDD